MRTILCLGLIGLFALGCASDSSDSSPSKQRPALDGFSWGGIAGDVCPPGSEGAGKCEGPDCGGSCVATDECSADDPSCGAGFVCDAEVGYCLPERTCFQSSECGDGQFCGGRTWGFSTGLCVDVPAELGASCEGSEACAFPAQCVDGSCALRCSDDFLVTCPSGWACVESACAPPL